MNDIYKYYLKKYLEKQTNLDKKLLFLKDKNGLLQDIEDIALYLYPHKVIDIKENVIFRSRYEDIKHNTDGNFILVSNNELTNNKLMDFIKRSEDGKIKEIDTQNLLECVEEEFKWSENINEYISNDIIAKFEELIYYRKLIKKKNIEKHEVDKILLSALMDLDCTYIKDEVDCYLYYRDITEIYTDINNLKNKYKNNVKNLLYKVFFEYGFSIASIIQECKYQDFVKLIWVSCALNNYKKLSIENIKTVLEDKANKIDISQFKLDELIAFTDLINKKDRKYYIHKKDWAEKLILKSGIDIISGNQDYKGLIREGSGSLINIIESIKSVLKDYNLEGLKKVFKYSLDNLFELKVLIDESNAYLTENVKVIKKLFDLIINMFNSLENVEKQFKYVGGIITYSDWEELYRNNLYDLQYRLSEIKYLDQQNIIENSRYKLIDVRISNILNQYRKHFAKYLEDNYGTWLETPYGVSRPILNSDIEDFINLEHEKTFILVFDGMRYDAWNYIVRPYFEKIFNGRANKFKSSFALLPSITSISREAIYSNILKKHKNDAVFMTKSESVANEDKLKEIILQDKAVNVFVFNMFDKDGHKATEDLYVFYDKQKKVFESKILELINLIPEDANIIISSDHGLMRIDEYENMKNEDNIESVRSRYMTLKTNMDLDGCVRITKPYDSLLGYKNKGYFIGGGEKDFYSHGGASLEEVIVPFIISETKVVKKTSSIKERVQTSHFNEQNDFELDSENRISLSFKLTIKEQIILTTLFKLKNQTVSNSDIEKILITKTGTAGMIQAIIFRLIKKLKNDGLDIIGQSAAGDLIMYRFNLNGLKEEN